MNKKWMVILIFISGYSVAQNKNAYSLSQAQEIALTNNESLKNASLDEEIARDIEKQKIAYEYAKKQKKEKEKQQYTYKKDL